MWGGVVLRPPLPNRKKDEMVKVKYKGHKDEMPIDLPPGCHKRSAMESKVVADPYCEMSQEHAEKLVELDPRNFEIVGAQSDEPKAEAGDDEPQEEAPKPKAKAKRKKAKKK